MTRKEISRRTMLRRTGCVAALSLLGTPQIFAGQKKATGEILRMGILSDQPNIYYGWPTVGLTAQGELLVSVSGGREEHVCPFGRVELFRSKDQGKTWTWPQTIYDGPTDDRDSGILVTSKGTILITTFTSLAYWEYVMKKEVELRAKGEKGKRLSDERYRRWMAVHTRISEQQLQKELGCWMLRSTDGGVNWSERYSSIYNSPHGPIELSDGRLLYPGKDLWSSDKEMGCSVSKDDGKSWEKLSIIPHPEGVNVTKEYHELHGVEAKDGTIVVQIRSHAKATNGETLQTESSDGGKTWSMPHSIGVWGLPSHLIRLKDDRLLMTYGYRRAPFGNQARLSEDNGKTWSEPIYVSKDGDQGDLGYPSTVQFSDGTLFSVWYESMKKNPKAVLRYAHWKIL